MSTIGMSRCADDGARKPDVALAGREKIPVVRDPAVADQLRSRGFAVVPIGDAGVVRELELLYDSLGCELRSGFHADMRSPNFAYRKAVVRGVRQILDGLIARVFVDHRIAVANYIVKEAAAPDSAVPLHQDWTVLEPPEQSWNVYTPLCDTTLENGCLQVLPGSHRTDRLGLAPYRPLPLEDPLRREIHERHLLSVPMKVGDCIIYDGRLLHASPPNLSPRRRIAVGIVVVPRRARLKLYYNPPATAAAEDVIEVFDVEDDFFTEYDMNCRPNAGIPVSRKPLVQRPITRDEVGSYDSSASTETCAQQAPGQLAP